MTEATKIMFIGLDSADPGLIREWSAEEALPNRKGLLDTGAWGPALGTHFGTGAYWPSVFSGARPAVAALLGVDLAGIDSRPISVIV